MATETVFDDKRAAIARQAAWELDSIAITLIDLCQGLEADKLVFRGLSIRVKELASTVMSAIDADESFEETHSRLTGRHEVQP